jgi:formylglycine-generating enzyme required for sulfatase activity
MLKALVSSESTRWVRSERDLAAAVQAEPASLAGILDALVRDRVLQREEVDGEVRYQLAHEYLIQEVGKWLDSQDLAIKQAQEILQRQVASWKQRKELLLPEAALHLINEQREALRELQLQPDEYELLIRSTLAADYEVAYWRQAAPAVVGKVEQELFGGLASEDGDEAQKAVSSLAALASTEIAERLVALVDSGFGARELTWIDHQGKSHAVRNSVLNLGAPAQRRAALALAKMALPEATAALARWTPPGMVLIPAGPFTMGSTASSEEGPVHEVWLDAFWIDRYPVTNAQWAAFLATDPWRQRELWTEAGWKWREASPVEPDEWSKLRKKGDHPVRYVCWYESAAYARWTGKALPSEAQWEKAARGADGRRYPWGEMFDKNKCNTSESGIRDTTSVGKYSPAGGDSPYRVADMAGNVWEWCRNLYVPYRYNAGDGREVLEGTGMRVLRGGSWYVNPDLAAAPVRYNIRPGGRNDYCGVRVCAVLPPP